MADEARAQRADYNLKKELLRFADHMASYGRDVHQPYPNSSHRGARLVKQLCKRPDAEKRR
jgi:hypothetical protein